MGLWYISVRNYKTSRKFRVKPEAGETAIECYRRAKAKAEEIKSKVGENVTVELISATTAFKPPEGYKKPRNHMWCPYCRKSRLFPFDEYRGVKRCIICGITENDFYIKKYNGVFYNEWMDYLRKKRSDKQ
jgi:hypothetical protein